MSLKKILFTRLIRLQIQMGFYLFIIGAHTENEERLCFFNCLHQLLHRGLCDISCKIVRDLVDIKLLDES